MAQGDATSADCPGRYDLVLNGKGYMLLQTLEPSLPFRSHRAIYTYSPTFVERQNVSNSYGDQAQDFFLTIRQRDWSLGEQQKYFRSAQDGRYWMGSNVDVSTPGQVNLFPQTPSVSFAGSVITGCKEGNLGNIVAASATTLYRSDQVGTITSNGAHGLGAAPFQFGATTDGINVFLSTETGGTVGVRKWVQSSTTFSTFSATGAQSLAFLNNTLYGLRNNAEDLVRYDTSGTATTVFAWRDAAGAAQGPILSRMEPFGGKLLLLLQYGQEAGGELWIYDGSGASRLEVFPPNFFAYDIEVLYGVAYISGNFFKAASSSTYYVRPAILFFDGSQIGILWEANAYSTATISAPSSSPYLPALGVYDGRLIFTDETNANLMAYNPAVGGVSTIGSYTSSGTQPRLLVSSPFVLHIRSQATGYYFPAISYPTSGYVISSLIDFDSSLVKQFRGIKVEWDAASDGDGGSIDIAYQTQTLTGAWTTLKTGAVNATEYTLTGVSGTSIATRITINKGTSTAGPTLRSISVRGAPQLQTFRNREYVLDLSGIGFKDPVKLADSGTHTLSGHHQADNLNTAIVSSSPILVSDRFCNLQTCLSGTTTTDSFLVMCEPSGCEIYDTAEGWDNPHEPGGYIAKITVREV